MAIQSPLILICAIIFCTRAFNPLVEITLKGSDGAIKIAEGLLEKSTSNGALKVQLNKEVKTGPMMQMDFGIDTWIGHKGSEMMVAGQKEMIVAILLDSIRNLGQAYVQSFQSLELQNEKWVEFAHRLTAHEMESPDELTAFLSADETRFVLFYKSDDKLTNSVAAVAVSLARRELQETEVIMVDCTHSESKCAEMNVKEFPALHCYHGSEFYADFDDSRLQTIDWKGVKDWVRGLLQPVVHEVDESQVPYYRSGIVPGFGDQRDTVHILFTDSKKNKVYKEFKQLATSLHGVFPFGALVNSEVAKWAIHPAIITMKPHEEVVQAYTQHTKMSIEEMREYVLAASDPALLDFTSARDVLRGFSPSLPVLVLFDPLGSSPSDDLVLLAGDADMTYRRNNARFASINGTNPFALSLLASFGLRQFDRAQWVLVNEQQGVSYVRPFKKENQEELKAFIAEPEKTSKPREIGFSLETIRNVLLGEILKDSEILYETRFSQEPGTLPRPPLHDALKDEL